MFRSDAIRSFSKGMISFTCFSVFENLITYRSVFMPFVSFFPLYDTFHLSLLTNLLTFSRNCINYVLFCGIRRFFIKPKVIHRINESVHKSAQLFRCINSRFRQQPINQTLYILLSINV